MSIYDIIVTSGCDDFAHTSSIDHIVRTSSDDIAHGLIDDNIVYISDDDDNTHGPSCAGVARKSSDNNIAGGLNYDDIVHAPNDDGCSGSNGVDTVIDQTVMTHQVVLVVPMGSNCDIIIYHETN